MKCIIFRVDANKRLGMGHLSRSIQLAKELKKLKIKTYFLIKNEKESIKIIKEAKFPFFIFSNLSNDEKELSELMKLHKKINFDCTIIDVKKSKNKTYFSKLNKICKTVVIDNTNKNSLFADLIVWPWVKEQYPKNITKKFSDKLLIGPKYMQLGNFQRKKMAVKDKKSILVSMGGSDKRNITLKIINSFKKTKHKFHMNIVIGRFFSNHEKILSSIKNDERFSLIFKNNGLIPLMSKNRIGIFTFGITTCEAFFVGIPSIVLSHSIENDIYAKKTSDYNCMKYLGYYKKINFDKMPKMVFNLMNNSNDYKKYAMNGKNMIDGKGNKRIAKEIFEMIK
ncbi:hypothetical protein [Nitrosopumilus sp.]|uniref:hypothetical protein n=1 Tax=Nitrosopumilus sp. TaxID=2024843 RepID=UPI003D126EAF